MSFFILSLVRSRYAGTKASSNLKRYSAFHSVYFNLCKVIPFSIAVCLAWTRTQCVCVCVFISYKTPPKNYSHCLTIIHFAFCKRNGMKIAYKFGSFSVLSFRCKFMIILKLCCVQAYCIAFQVIKMCGASSFGNHNLFAHWVRWADSVEKWSPFFGHSFFRNKNHRNPCASLSKPTKCFTNIMKTLKGLHYPPFTVNKL